MLPKTHIVLGAIFSILLFFLLDISLMNSLLIFFASFLIDVDHYLWYVFNKRDFSLKRAFNWHVKTKDKSKYIPFMHIFHTIEFIILLSILSFFFEIFLFFLIGILFHSILDLISMFYDHSFNEREYSLIFYIFKKIVY